MYVFGCSSYLHAPHRLNISLLSSLRTREGALTSSKSLTSFCESVAGPHPEPQLHPSRHHQIFQHQPIRLYLCRSTAPPCSLSLRIKVKTRSLET